MKSNNDTDLDVLADYSNKYNISMSKCSVATVGGNGGDDGWRWLSAVVVGGNRWR